MRSRLYLSLFTLLFFAKLALAVFLKQNGLDIFGGGNDSDYYDAYALGHTDNAVNIWAILLRHLNSIGLYSRGGMSFFLMFLGIVAIPFLVSRLSIEKESILKRRVFWLTAVIIAAYPTIFFFTLDIYRDVFMVFVFLVGVAIFKKISDSATTLSILFLFLAGLTISYILYLFRPYLGFGYLIALMGAKFYSFRKFPLITTLLIYLITLNAIFYVGLMQPIVEYRDLFGGIEAGGSNLGISFSSAVMFLPDLIKSFIFQMLGIYFVNSTSIFVFIIESVPFIAALTYVLKNRAYSNKFVDYLVVFFIVYSTIWLLGNDNLGTAVRLRIYNYISICIACAVIYQNKRKILNLSQYGMPTKQY